MCCHQLLSVIRLKIFAIEHSAWRQISEIYQILSFFNVDCCNIAHQIEQKILHTVEPRFLDNAVNGDPPLVYNKLQSQILQAFCNAKLPLDNGHAFSGDSPI